MKKVIFAIMLTFGASATASPTPAPLPDPTGAPLSMQVLMPALLVAAVLFDKEQACDKLAVKTEKSANGNYTYDVAGCDQ